MELKDKTHVFTVFSKMESTRENELTIMNKVRHSFHKNIGMGIVDVLISGF